MITFGICLIYYGIALFLYQLYGLVFRGVWTPYPVQRIWEGLFGVPHGRASALDSLFDWFMAWPASLALLSIGLGVLGAVYLYRRAAELRRARLRRKWVVEQCADLDYKPWAVPKVLQDLDERMQAEKLAQREEAG